MARAAGRQQGGFPLACLFFLGRRSFTPLFLGRGQTTLTHYEKAGIVPSASWLIPFESINSRRIFLDLCMNRKSVLFGIGVGLLVVSVVTFLVLLLVHEPAVYARASQPEGKERRYL